MTEPNTPTPGTTPVSIPANHTVREEIADTRVSVRFPVGFPNPFTAKDVTDLIYLKINDYIDEDLTEEMLAEACVEDFSEFGIDTWNAVTKESRRSLRNFLHQRGVFVKHGNSIKMANALEDFIRKGFFNWPDDEPRPRHNTRFCPLGRLPFNRPTAASEQDLSSDQVQQTALAVQRAILEPANSANKITPDNQHHTENDNDPNPETNHTDHNTPSHLQTNVDNDGNIHVSLGGREHTVHQTGTHNFTTRPNHMHADRQRLLASGQELRSGFFAGPETNRGLLRPDRNENAPTSDIGRNNDKNESGFLHGVHSESHLLRTTPSDTNGTDRPQQ